MLPEPYMPLPPPELRQLHGEGTRVPELAATSASNDVPDVPQHLLPSRTFKSQVNSYSLFWLYNHDTLPINDPEDTSGSTVLDINCCCGLFTDYISARAHYSRLRSTIVPSVACQTTEGEYLLLTTLPTY